MMWKRGFILLWILANEGIEEAELLEGIRKQLSTIDDDLEQLLRDLLAENIAEERENGLYITENAKPLLKLMLNAEDNTRMVFSEYMDENGNTIRGIRSYNMAYKNGDKILYDFFGEYETYKLIRDKINAK